MFGRRDVLAVLRDKGADLNKCDNNGWSPAYRAAYEGQVGALELLRDAGADLTAADKRGKTPLIVAAGEGNTEALRVLIGAGGDVNKAAEVTFCRMKSIQYRGRKH